MGARIESLPMAWRAQGAAGIPTVTDERFGAEPLDYLDALYGTALRLTRNQADAEDLVQDTYLKAIRFSSRFTRGTNLRAWLFTILHNTFLNQRRRQHGDPVLTDSDAAERAAAVVPTATESIEANLVRQSTDAEIREALDALPVVFREAVWLRDAEDLSYTDIAKALAVPVGTVMSRISRGRRLLAERLAGTRTPTAASVRAV